MDKGQSPTHIAIEDLFVSIKFLYFEYMINYKDPSKESFKETLLQSSSLMIDKIHDKYADHIESYRKDADNMRAIL